mmetsp:Transcript_52279/g.136137  ORF Transcript_52279/g.136137 Transcript_52279/m.136137 type:complete len:278 (+) Transcript_52279:2-835(+)
MGDRPWWSRGVCSAARRELQPKGVEYSALRRRALGPAGTRERPARRRESRQLERRGRAEGGRRSTMPGGGPHRAACRSAVGPPKLKRNCRTPVANPRTPPMTIRVISSSWKTGWSRLSNSAGASSRRRCASVASTARHSARYACAGWPSGSAANLRRPPHAAPTTASGTMNGTLRRSSASNSARRSPLASSATRRGLVSTRLERKAANSTETSGCRFSKRPWSTKGPTGTGSTGSKMSLMAIQLVTYPTSEPATGRVQFLGKRPHRNICPRPSAKPK